MRIRRIAGAALLLASHAEAQSQTSFNLMPMPTSVQPGVGRLPIDQSFCVSIAGIRDETLERGTARFLKPLHAEVASSPVSVLILPAMAVLWVRTSFGEECIVSMWLADAEFPSAPVIAEP